MGENTSTKGKRPPKISQPRESTCQLSHALYPKSTNQITVRYPQNHLYNPNWPHKHLEHTPTQHLCNWNRNNKYKQSTILQSYLLKSLTSYCHILHCAKVLLNYRALPSWLWYYLSWFKESISHIYTIPKRTSLFILFFW